MATVYNGNMEIRGETGRKAPLPVRVWYARCRDFVDVEVLNQCRQALDADEFDQYHRFVIADVRQNYLLAHGLLRWALSEAALLLDRQVEPAQWMFAKSDSGKPLITGPCLRDELQFSLTHTKGLVACAISRVPVGIDAEWADRRVSAELADSYFSAVEIERLAALAASEKTKEFLRMWTLKESYIKGIGLGLSHPLDTFWFDDPGSESPHIVSASGGRIGGWCFARQDLTGSDHFLAAAAKVAAQSTVRFELQEAVPFAGTVAGTTKSFDCRPD